MTPVSRPTTTILLALLAVLLGAGVYLNALDNPFVFDDTTEVLENPSIQHPTHVTALIRYAPTRPVVNMSYALDYSAWGLEPFGYHLTNLLLHLINIALLFLLARAYATDRGSGSALPLTAAALFAVHPLLSETVGYVSSRSELLAGAFMLSSLYAFRSGLVHGRLIPLLIGFGFFALAGASKETGAMLPFVLLAYDRLILGDGGGWKPRRRFLYVHAPLIALVIAAGAFRTWRYVTVEHPGSATIDWNNALLNLHVLTQYVSLFVAPVSLSLVHDVRQIQSALDLRILTGAAVLGALLWMAAVWRRREPIISFGILWFLLILIPSAALIVVADKGQPMAEHRVYVASCGLFLAVGAGWSLARQQLTENIQPVAIGMLMVVIAALGTLTVARNRVWADPVRLWQDAARKAPRTYMAQYGVGESYRAAGDCEAAVPAYERAIGLRPTLEDGYLGLAECLTVNERPDEAMQVLRVAVERAKTTVKSRLNLASYEAERGNPAEALRLCQEVLAAAPNEPNAVACIERNVAAASLTR
jgi:hypothetical protein